MHTRTWKDYLLTAILVWGYVDCPPFTPFVAHIAEMLFGTSLVGIHFFPTVAQGLVLILTGLMVQRMGGNRWAQVIAAGGEHPAQHAPAKRSTLRTSQFRQSGWVWVPAAGKVNPLGVLVMGSALNEAEDRIE